jgi:NhaP-type Na+/H+ or K+/H+ antiporter
VLGWVLGWSFSRMVLHLRREREQALGMESFLTLGLIALTYGLALTINSYGFLAVFVAGLAMRSVEFADSDGKRHAHGSDESPKTSAYMARVVLDFALDIERLAELTVMLLVGSLLHAEVFNWASLGMAAALLLVVRPLAVQLTLIGSDLTRGQRRLAAWFGIRGVGSIYYLAFAISHGVVGDEATWVAQAVLATVVASVVLHGASATPAMRLYRRARRSREHGGR